jgi:hypothetical protein
MFYKYSSSHDFNGNIYYLSQKCHNWKERKEVNQHTLIGGKQERKKKSQWEGRKMDGRSKKGEEGQNG